MPTIGIIAQYPGNKRASTLPVAVRWDPQRSERSSSPSPSLSLAENPTFSLVPSRRSPSPTSTLSSDEARDGRAPVRRPTRSGIFYKASNFILNNPVLQSIQHGWNGDSLSLGEPPFGSDVEFSANDPALERLAAHTISGASFDSSAKDPPPRCHPETRHYIIDKALHWFHRLKRDQSILWLSGPAGVGKTAIIRSMAYTESESGRLGATIFFSRSNKRDDSARFVPTLSYQLAVGIPPYQDYVKDQIIADPELPRKGSKELFRKLIVEPFGHQRLCENTGPWLILVDGLDECDGGERAQREIVEMISDFVRQFPESPLVWIIASRSEPCLKTAFSRLCAEHKCWMEYIGIDTQEARKDVELYLRSELAAIREDSRDLIPSGQTREWPGESKIVGISRAASGYFAFAFAAIQFIRDPVVGNPNSQLTFVLSTIDKLGFASHGRSPWSGLYDLYLQVLRAVPPPTYTQVTKRILGCADLLPRNTFQPTSFMLSCNFLGVKQGDAYASLQRLHSVLEVPSHAEAATQEIKFLHSSFTDFLRNRSASNEFYVGRLDTGADIVRSSFRILQEANKDCGSGQSLEKNDDY